jgi:hypothetical protein
MHTFKGKKWKLKFKQKLETHFETFVCHTKMYIYANNDVKWTYHDIALCGDG